MATTSIAPDTPPTVLEYRLTEADVRRFSTSGRARACRKLCRSQGWGLLGLALLGLLLTGVCYRGHGLRSAGLAWGIAAAIVTAFAWSREYRARRLACRMARDLGVPMDLRLVATADGLTKEPAPDGSDPGRTFDWSEVVEVYRVDHLTVVRLRPAGGVLLIPDRAFAEPDARERFEADARRWLAAARPG